MIDPDSRVSLVLGASDERFQIPDVSGQKPGLASAGANPA